MAKEDYQKKLVGYAVLSNNLLDKVAMTAEETLRTNVRIEKAVVQGVSVSEKIHSALNKQTKLLVEIRDLLKSSPTAKGGKAEVSGFKKLAMAGGLIALMGLGMMIFIQVFKMSKDVDFSTIARGIAIAIAMIPISKAFAEVIKAMPASILASPFLMIKVMAGLATMAVGYAIIAIALRATPILTPSQLLNSIAVAGVFYIVGTIFAKLMSSMRHNGVASFFMNRNLVQRTMASMVIMALSIVVIALAMKVAPRITPAQGLGFAAASLALIPLAIAFKQLKWVFILSRKFKISDVKKTTIMLSIVALALIPLGFAAQLIPAVSPAVAKTLFNLALVMIPISIIVQLIMSSINGTGNKGIMNRVLGPAAPKPEKTKTSAKDKIKGILMWTATVVAVFIGMGAIAYVLGKAAPQFASIATLDFGSLLKLVLVVGIAGLVVSMMVRMMKGGSSSSSGGLLGILGNKQKSKTGKIQLNDIIMAAIALPLVAMGLVGVAYIFQYLPEGKLKSPGIEWTAKASLAILIFSLPIILATRLTKGVKAKDFAMGILAVTAIAIGVLAVAWVFSVLPDTFQPIPIDWAISAAIAITIFAIPVGILGAIVVASGGTGALALLGGAAGIILIAGTMWVVSWIFSKLPDLSAISKNFTDALMYPVNSMIDALVRFKEQIGIENMLPLAGGLVAIAGGWLALTGALAGTAVGGLIQGVANVGTAILDGIAGLFGSGKKTKTPIDLLDMLIARTDGIVALADPVKQLGKSFGQISKFTPTVIRGITAFSPFLDKGKATNFTMTANAATKLASAYNSIALSTKLMNVPALNASARMFEAIAEIAENKGQDAISELAKSLMAAVKELSETVKNLEEASSGQQESISDAISGAMSSFIDKIKGKTDETGKETGLVDIEPIVLAIQELEERFDRAIKVVPVS